MYYYNSRLDHRATMNETVSGSMHHTQMLQAHTCMYKSFTVHVHVHVDSVIVAVHTVELT